MFHCIHPKRYLLWPAALKPPWREHKQKKEFLGARLHTEGYVFCFFGIYRICWTVNCAGWKMKIREWLSLWTITVLLLNFYTLREPRKTFFFKSTFIKNDKCAKRFQPREKVQTLPLAGKLICISKIHQGVSMAPVGKKVTLLLFKCFCGRFCGDGEVGRDRITAVSDGRRQEEPFTS